jgi:hypothetical protein
MWSGDRDYQVGQVNTLAAAQAPRQLDKLADLIRSGG